MRNSKPFSCNIFNVSWYNIFLPADLSLRLISRMLTTTSAMHSKSTSSNFSKIVSTQYFLSDFAICLSAATIQDKAITSEQQSQLFWLQVSVGLVLSSITAGISPLVAYFYREPALIGVTIGLAPTFLITALSAQSAALLLRRPRQSGAGL